jgi:hypothetical protein
VNTHAEYRRHSYRPPEPSPPLPSTEAAAIELARHRDPSLPAAEGQAPTKAAKGIAWVRPTELATYITPMVGRGVDLHTELIRRARRSPVTTTRSLKRGIRHSPAQTPTANRTEGLSL